MDVPFKLDWPRRIEDAHGLVLPYASEKRVVSVAECIDNAIASRGGWVGVHGNGYLGFCAVTDLRIVGLVAAASAIEDTVVFYPRDGQGAIAVDCYPSNPGEAFSLFVQGDALVDELAPCFSSEDGSEGS
ncbi:hypothetical protein QFW77_15040 [Luteimonas sp. RD2P54]|uniref:Uncharacterized protein n=1 Tax=Luteimonas endophytica TaxID=3042023 RepID=A0ABT6JBU1_9GAMM|nr:hypothetical protein [Luteimonas endophytica]MDH5824292.1 hypothetical protein [Luteimonas endophytica]